MILARGYPHRCKMRSMNGVITNGRNWVNTTSFNSGMELQAIAGPRDALFQLLFGVSSSPSGDIFPAMSSGIS